MCAVNDPLGQTSSSSDYYPPLKIVLFGEIWKVGMDTTCENSDHCGSASWITNGKRLFEKEKTLSICKRRKKKCSNFPTYNIHNLFIPAL